MKISRWEKGDYFHLLAILTGWGGGLLYFQAVLPWKDWQTWLLIASAVTILAVVSVKFHAWNKLVAILEELNVAAISIPIPGMPSLSIRLNTSQRQAVWKIYIELSTRIATQSLANPEKSGNLREALSSLKTLFDLVRSEWKSTSPNASFSEDNQGFEQYIFPLLNDVIRPCLSRWHPRLKEWESTGLPERLWPLEDLCRQDLENTRKGVLEYVNALAAGLKVPNISAIRQDCTSQNTFPLSKICQIEALDKQLLPNLGKAEFSAGWRVLLQFRSGPLAKPLPAPLTPPWLDNAAKEIPLLIQKIRDEMKECVPYPNLADGGETVGFLLLDMASILAPFYNSTILAWESWKKQPSENLDAWPKNGECLTQLTDLQVKLKTIESKLASLLGIEKN